MTSWRIIVAAIDETGAIETIEVSDKYAENIAYVYAGEPGIFIQTNPTGLGDFQDERIIPWRRILDYRKTE